MIKRTEFILQKLKELYALSNMPDNIYSADYIVKTLFKPQERTRELIQKIQIIINGSNTNDRTKAKAA